MFSPLTFVNSIDLCVYRFLLYVKYEGISIVNNPLNYFLLIYLFNWCFKNKIQEYFPYSTGQHYCGRKSMTIRRLLENTYGWGLLGVSDNESR